MPLPIYDVFVPNHDFFVSLPSFSCCYLTGRPIKIEIIVDTDDASSSQAKVPSQPQIPSLLARISGVKSQVVNMSVTV